MKPQDSTTNNIANSIKQWLISGELDPEILSEDFLFRSPFWKQANKNKFIKEIGHAYENIGFVALKGHFLDNELVDSLYTEIKNFFDLPDNVKESYEIPGIGGQRGYVSFGKESAKGKKEGDLDISNYTALMMGGGSGEEGGGAGFRNGAACVRPPNGCASGAVKCDRTNGRTRSGQPVSNPAAGR